MTQRTSVVDWSGNYEENCTQLGRHLGRNAIRRKLFAAIYGRGSRSRSKKQLMAAVGLNTRQGQQAQNQLDYLARYGLIVRDDNNGAVEDRSRYVYGKDPDVRAHRKDIVKYADKPALAKRVPTKRNPVPRGSTAAQVIITPRALKKKKVLEVLYLMANPDATNYLRLDAEIKAVVDAIRGSKFRDNIKINQSPAADLDSIIQGLNDYTPRLVNFSGHGYTGGVAVDSAHVQHPHGMVVTFDLLGRALASVDSPPDIVVLNACKSVGARKALLPPAKALVVMNDSISDVAATAFATKFYAAIASGQSLKSAFKQGRVAIEVTSIGEVNIPELLTAKGVNPAKVILV